MKFYGLKSVKQWLVVTALSGCISGCSVFGYYPDPVLAEPLQVSFESELELANISQKLYSKDIDANSQVQLLFKRATIYDSFGFRAFAQSDFNQVLNYGVEIPEIYNFLGIYAMNDGDFSSAFIAYNSALELDEDYQFAYINRAIALYRNERFDAAKADALKFYHYSPNEPVRLLWLYLIEDKIDAKIAKEKLQSRFDRLEDQSIWGCDIIRFYLGQLSESRLMINLQQNVANNRELAERLSETYFYLGKYYQRKGDIKRAEVLFKYALSNNVYNFIEHQQAQFEIQQLAIK